MIVFDERDVDVAADSKGLLAAVRRTEHLAVAARYEHRLVTIIPTDTDRADGCRLEHRSSPRGDTERVDRDLDPVAGYELHGGSFHAWPAFATALRRVAADHRTALAVCRWARRDS